MITKLLKEIHRMEADVRSKKRAINMTWIDAGEAFRQARASKKLSLRDLGKLLGEPGHPVSAAFLSDIENGRRHPSQEMQNRMLEVLA